MFERFSFEKLVSSLKEKDLDFTERTIPYHNGKVKIFYIAQLTDRVTLSDSVIKPLILHCSSNNKTINAQMTLDSIIFADSCKLESDTNKVEEHILKGMVVILFSTEKEYLVVNLKKVEHRSIPTPDLTYSIRGPQDCFTENLDTNLSLIRYRVKDKNLSIKMHEVGERSKTRVAVIYIDDIANDIAVNEIQKRIDDIKIDGIGESGELQSFLLNNKFQLFPNIGLVERSDMAYHSLIEGKVIVLVDGSGLALLAPKTFPEFFYSYDDRFDNKYFGLFSRIIRYLSIVIALCSTSIFVGLTSFHTDALPIKYVIILAQMRTNVPFPAIIGAISLEFIQELLRESLLRVPKHIGPAIGIVGAIVIGSAAIDAGIFSPLLLILSSVSLLASFAIPDYTLLHTFRILKFGLLICTGMLGFVGFTMFLLFIITQIVSMNSFGTPYMAPWAPSNSYDFIRSFINTAAMDPKKPKYLRTKDKNNTNENDNK